MMVYIEICQHAFDMLILYEHNMSYAYEQRCVQMCEARAEELSESVPSSASAGSAPVAGVAGASPSADGASPSPPARALGGQLVPVRLSGDQAQIVSRTEYEFIKMFGAAKDQLTSWNKQMNEPVDPGQVLYDSGDGPLPDNRCYHKGHC